MFLDQKLTIFIVKAQNKHLILPKSLDMHGDLNATSGHDTLVFSRRSNPQNRATPTKNNTFFILVHSFFTSVKSLCDILPPVGTSSHRVVRPL